MTFHPNLLPWLQLDLAIGADLHQRLPNLLDDGPIAHLRFSKFLLMGRVGHFAHLLPFESTVLPAKLHCSEAVAGCHEKRCCKDQVEKVL